MPITFLDLGCGGGLMDNAFLFDENSTGICSEEDYPYVMHKRWLRGCGSEKGECTPVPHTRVKTFEDVENTVDALMDAIAQQPVSVAMYVLSQHSRGLLCFVLMQHTHRSLFSWCSIDLITVRPTLSHSNSTSLVYFLILLVATTWTMESQQLVMAPPMMV